jgi:hypothetical protein
MQNEYSNDALGVQSDTAGKEGKNMRGKRRKNMARGTLY